MRAESVVALPDAIRQQVLDQDGMVLTPVESEVSGSPGGGTDPDLPSTGRNSNAALLAGLLALIGGSIVLVARRPARN